MRYSAADLKHHVYIQRDANLDLADQTDDDDNALPPDWTSLTTSALKAGKKGLQGRTFFAAAAAHAEDNLLIVMRYNSVTAAVTTDMRIVEGEKAYEITTPPVDVDDAHQWIEIRVRELSVNGG